MKYLAFVIAALLAAPLPAAAKDFVQDQAAMFSQSTIDALNNRISNFNAQTGKEIVVQTVPSVADGDVRTAAENAFSQQQVNGVLIFISKGDRKDYIVPDRAAVQAGWWSSQTSTSIAQAMEAQFRAGDFDGGITTAVGLALNVYRSHLGSLNGSGGYQPQRSTYAQPASRNAVHISMFWIIILVLVGFFILRSLMRAASGPRYYGGGGYGPGGPGPGPGGGYGYGPGYGWGGGGGGFFSGLLGGLGGAWLGNELFRGQNYGGGNIVDPNAGAQPPMDAGGWQSDAGQGDAGGGGGGDWGGGGFGGGDFGGGGGGFGGGDFGGGGGGGGW